MRAITGIVTLAAVFATAAPAPAQLLAAKDGPVVYGHHHLTVTDVAAHRRFWVDTLGGRAAKLGTTEAAVFPNVIVLLRQGAPAGGTKGTTVNHVGFGVPDLAAVVSRSRPPATPWRRGPRRRRPSRSRTTWPGCRTRRRRSPSSWRQTT
ncbi:MAG: VOC family protein [Vicinamibacterales bacterium]